MIKQVGGMITIASLAGSSGIARGQAFTQSFDDVTTLTAAGWFQQNNSDMPNLTPWWFQGNGAVFASHSGALAAYIATNYNASVGTTGTETVSNWLLTPAATFQNGDTLTFWTRTASQDVADRLEVRLSTTGSGTNVGTLSGDVGDFTTVLLTINPTLATSGATAYPAVWTQYTVTLSGLSGSPTGRFAFRYYVTNSGPVGPNGNYVGIDDVVYTPGGTAGGACYANCDGSTAVPFLNVLDFTCFLQKFAAADPYANCDNSTQAPTLNVLDFTCFLQKFAAGCSAP
jgi:hypothetical protein